MQRKKGTAYSLLAAEAACTELFRGVAPADLENLLGQIGAFRKTVRKGAFVVHEGTPVKSIYVIVSGRVLVSEHAGGDRRHVVRDLSAGREFGLTMLYTPFHKSEAVAWPSSDGLPFWPGSVQAVENTVLIGFDLIRARRVSAHSDQRFHPVYVNAVRLLSEGLLDVWRKLAVLDGASVEEMVLRHLLYLDAEGGCTGRVTLPFSQMEWARYLAVGRSSLCRALRELKRSGSIDWRGRSFRLLNKR